MISNDTIIFGADVPMHGFLATDVLFHSLQMVSLIFYPARVNFF